MNCNFTDSVRQALAMAREEALRLRHEYVGTEHILLGLNRLDGFVSSFDLDPVEVATRVEEAVRPGKSTIRLGELPYTSRAKKVLEYAMAASRELGLGAVAPEQLFLGVLREEKGIAAQVLFSMGVDVEGVWRTVRQASGAESGLLERVGQRQRLRILQWSDEVNVIRRNAMSAAAVLRHDYVGTEHLLLALSHDEELMARFGIQARDVRELIERRAARGGKRSAEAKSLVADAGSPRGLPFTSRALKALEYAMRETGALSDAGASAQASTRVFFLPDHLIVGLLLEEKGIAAQVLGSVGVDLESARDVAASARQTTARQTEAATGFPITIDDQSESSSIYQQIIDRIREGIATGALEPGQRLQSVRGLADQLDIAPGTVARAYAELERLGVVVTGGARGTRVAEPRKHLESSDRVHSLAGLLRPVAVAAFHMGGSAAELRQALESAMVGILDEGTPAP